MACKVSQLWFLSRWSSLTPRAGRNRRFFALLLNTVMYYSHVSEDGERTFNVALIPGGLRLSRFLDAQIWRRLPPSLFGRRTFLCRDAKWQSAQCVFITKTRRFTLVCWEIQKCIRRSFEVFFILEILWCSIFYFNVFVFFSLQQHTDSGCVLEVSLALHPKIQKYANKLKWLLDQLDHQNNGQRSNRLLPGYIRHSK